MREPSMPPSGLPPTGYLRLNQIIRQPAIAPTQRKGRYRRGRPASVGVFPVSASTWWRGIKEGRFPKPVSLGLHTTAWRVEDIRALIRSVAGTPAGTGPVANTVDGAESSNCANTSGPDVGTKGGSRA